MNHCNIEMNFCLIKNIFSVLIFFASTVSICYTVEQGLASTELG